MNIATALTTPTDNDGSPKLVNGRPEGQLDYELNCNIREAVALYGFEVARDMIAQSLNRTNDRIARR